MSASPFLGVARAPQSLIAQVGALPESSAFVLLDFLQVRFASPAASWKKEEEKKAGGGGGRQKEQGGKKGVEQK